MKNIFTVSFAFICLHIFAQAPTNYYNSAEGKSEAALKTALFSIISSNSVDKGYDYLYTIYKTSDKTASGNVWDMYSTCTWYFGSGTCGNYSNVCDCYNREHSIPQSWFDKAKPMVSDAFHIYPTDGKVNGIRGNYPFGEAGNALPISGKGLGKLGTSTFPGYSGTVFEPVDEYKGDFARTYFYFATRYENIMTTIGGESFNKTKYPSFSGWSRELFLKWHRQDPVSQKEIDRNNAIYVYQKNRNPFIDFPELAEFVWGTKTGQPWNINTGIGDLEIKFSLYPNPASDYINIESDESNLQYFIFTVSGQLLQQGDLTVSRTVMLQAFREGMYLIKLQSGEKQTFRKFILKNK